MSSALAAALSGCSTIENNLKASPISNTSFVDEALSVTNSHIVATPAGVYPFHRAWKAEDGISTKNTRFFITPINVEHVGENSGRKKPRISFDDVQKLASYMETSLKHALQKRSLQIVEDHSVANRTIELAIVEVRPTDVARNVMGVALGAVVPGGGIVSARSSGSIAIEGIIRDSQSNVPVLIFADRERGRTAPFSFNDFTLYSHARAAIDDWAEQIAEVLTSPSGTRIADSSAVTLLPL